MKIDGAADDAVVTWVGRNTDPHPFKWYSDIRGHIAGLYCVYMDQMKGYWKRKRCHLAHIPFICERIQDSRFGEF